MASTTAERMAAYRNRQRASGFKTVSLVVPAEEAELFQAFANERRRSTGRTRSALPLRQHWNSVLGSSHAANDTAEPHVPSHTRERTKSRAQAIAEAIFKRVIALGWPVGHTLGFEAELMKQFAVSRTVLRQAIRLLEHYGVARIHRGSTGGLVITAPDAAATIRSVSIYLEHERIRPADIVETRRILEQATATFAVQRMTRKGEARLNAVIEAEASLDGEAPKEALQRFHFTVAELSGDPALRLFAGIVLQLSDAHSTFSRRSRADRDKVVRRIKHLHRSIAEAMIARDADTACRLIARYLDGYKDWLE